MNTMKICSAMRKDEILQFVKTRMELEDTVLGEAAQIQKDKHSMISLIWNLKTLVVQNSTVEQLLAETWEREQVLSTVLR